MIGKYTMSNNFGAAIIFALQNSTKRHFYTGGSRSSQYWLVAKRKLLPKRVNSEKKMVWAPNFATLWQITPAKFWRQIF